MWGGQGYNLHVIVGNQLSCLVIGVLEAVRAQTGLINDEVSNVLSMFNRSSGVVYILMTFTY